MLKEYVCLSKYGELNTKKVNSIMGFFCFRKYKVIPGNVAQRLIKYVPNVLVYWGTFAMALKRFLSLCKLLQL